MRFHLIPRNRLKIIRLTWFALSISMRKWGIVRFWYKTLLIISIAITRTRCLIGAPFAIPTSWVRGKVFRKISYKTRIIPQSWIVITKSRLMGRRMGKSSLSWPITKITASLACSYTSFSSFCFNFSWPSLLSVSVSSNTISSSYLPSYLYYWPKVFTMDWFDILMKTRTRRLLKLKVLADLFISFFTKEIKNCLQFRPKIPRYGIRC